MKFGESINLHKDNCKCERCSRLRAFNEFIATGILDDNEFQEYEICITKFDDKRG